MQNRIFNQVIMIGEIEFKVSGKYNPKYDLENPLEIEYNDVFATVLSDGNLIEIDGIPLLDSFEAWDQLEKKIIETLEDEDEDEESDDDDEDDDDYRNLRYSEDDSDDES